MKPVDLAVLALGILSIAFGVLGFVGATSGHGSPISLIAGGGLGAALLALLAYTKTNPRVGRIGSAVVTLVLLGWSASTYFKKHTVYPHGIMMVASLATFGILGYGHMAATKSRSAGN